MVDFLGVPLSVINISGWAAFVLVVWVIFRLLITGKLRTEREVEELREDRDARIGEAAKWELAFGERGQTITSLLRQNEMLLNEFGSTAAKALDAIPHEGQVSDR